MFPLKFALAILASLCCAGVSFAQGINNVFDMDGTETYQGGFSSANWIDGTIIRPSTLTPNAGSLFFAVGNSTPDDLPGLGFTKNLGGTIQNTSYTISMEVAYYGSGISPVLFSDFSTLQIGGSAGTYQWTSTPMPSKADTWTQWTGIYTPAPADIGNNFVFDAVMDARSETSLAIDGPVVATPTPEPGSAVLAAAGALVCAARRPRKVSTQG